MQRQTRWPLLIGLWAVACSPVPSSISLPEVPAGAPNPFRITATGARYTAFPSTTGHPADWKDASKDVSPVPTWLFPGKWWLLPSLSGFSGGVFHQDETGAYPHVTIRRYAGTVFGADGRLPAKYRVAFAVQPFEQADHMPPIGENGILVYYRNPTNYVELVVSGGNVAVWSANNASPTSSTGWTGHYWYGYKTNAGDIRRLSAEVDTAAHTLTYGVEGQKAATVTVPMLTDTTFHTLALRSIGNKINFGEVVIDDLTGGTEPAPSPTPTPSPTPSPSSGSTTPTSFQSWGTLPQAVIWAKAAAKNNLVYVSGGSNGSQSYATVWSSPVQNPWIWQARTALPSPTEGHGFAVIGNYAYVVGGWARGSGPRSAVYKALINSDGSLGAWQATTPLPQGRALHGLVTDGNRLIVLGGWSPSFAPTVTVWTAMANADGTLAAWQSLPSLPVARAFGSACIAGDKLLFVGGSNSTSVYQASYANGQLGAWQSGPALPEALQGHSCLTLGGVATTVGASSKVYQLLNGSWQATSSLPVSRSSQATTAVGNQVFALGGQSGSSLLNSVLAATLSGSAPLPSPTPTPTTPTATPTPTPTVTAAPSTGFQSAGSLPQALVWHGAAAKNGLVYVSGGTNGNQSYTGVWSAAAQSPGGWQSRTSLPSPTEGHGFAIVGNYAYVVGGWGRGSAPRSAVYKALVNADGSLGAWAATTSLPQGRAFHALVVDGNRLIVLGGWNPSYAATNTVWTATLAADGSVSAWAGLPSLPGLRAWAGGGIVNGKLYLTGGSNGSATQATVYQANYSNGTLGSWALGPALPQPIEGHGCQVIGGRLTTFGGDNYLNGVPLPTGAILQLDSTGWKTVNQYPAARFGQAMATSGTTLLHLGGHDAQHAVLTSIWKGWP